MVKIFLHRVTPHKIKLVPTMLTLLILNLLQSPAFPWHASTQHLNKKKGSHYYYYISFSTQLFSTSFLLFGTISGKVSCFITVVTYYFWQVLRSLCDHIASLGSRLPFLGNHWSRALNLCTWNRWYDSGPSWNLIYFSFWTFPFQSGLLFPMGHTLLPLSGILLDPHSDNFGRCVLLLHMNSMTWCMV